MQKCFCLISIFPSDYERWRRRRLKKLIFTASSKPPLSQPLNAWQWKIQSALLIECAALPWFMLRRQQFYPPFMQMLTWGLQVLYTFCTQFCQLCTLQIISPILCFVFSFSWVFWRYIFKFNIVCVCTCVLGNLCLI